MKNARVLILLFLSVSCSLKYTEGVKNVEQTVPEFIFNDALLVRYEDGHEKLSLSAEKLEQYKGGNDTYASNMQFAAFDAAGTIETEGSCRLLAFNAREKKYSLYDNIELINYPRHVVIRADELRWNGKSEQLTSGRSDTITIVKDNTMIIGSGFSASGVSNTFVFTGVVSGTVETDDDETHGEALNGND
ncbi:MAG: LPS export ABC transporter periplasmic protein LptC [Treponema sp.]|nr:LPS export ABC transporter periplasmic protein LptC [Treponema sp.]